MMNRNKDGRIFTYCLIASLFLVFLFIYLPVLSLAHGYWSKITEAYAHGYILLGATIYLLYLKRNDIFSLNKPLSTKYFYISLLPVLFCTVLIFFAYSTQVMIVQLVGVILLIWLWIAVVFGKSSAIHAALPIGLLLMAIPLWDGIGLFLRMMTVSATQAGLSWLGIIAFIDGYTIELSGGLIEVAASCSGLKYLLAGTSLAIIYSEMNINTAKRKIMVVLLGIAISIMANWVRVFGIVLIADISEMKSDLVHDHENFGWLVFAVSFAMFILIVNKIEPGIKENKELKQDKLPIGRATGLADNFIYRAFTVTMVAIALPVYSWSVVNISGNNLITHEFQFEGAKVIYKPNWLPAYSGFDEMITWGLTVKERELEVTTATYLNQKQGKELIYYSNKLNDSGYELREVDSMMLSKNMSINRSIISNNSQVFLVAWFYKVGNFETGNKYIAKLLQIVSMVQGVPVASLVTMSVECESTGCSDEKVHILSSELVEKFMDSIKLDKTIHTR